MSKKTEHTEPAFETQTVVAANGEKPVAPSPSNEDFLGHQQGIGRLAAVPIEELVYYANKQRVKYGVRE